MQSVLRCRILASRNKPRRILTSARPRWDSNSPFEVEPMAGIEPATDGLRNRCSTAELHWLCQSERAAVNQTKRSGENSRPKSLSSHFQWFHSEKNEIGSKSIRPLVPRWRAAVAGPLPGMLGVWPTPRGFPLMSKAVHTRVKLYAASPLDAPAVKIPMRFQAVALSQ